LDFSIADLQHGLSLRETELAKHQSGNAGNDEKDAYDRDRFHETILLE
jgi:hypothetical protein